MLIVYDNGLGGISVSRPISGANLTVDELVASVVPLGATHALVQDDQFPVDRMFRNAWRLAGSAVTVDMEPAREIAHDLRREARQAQLKPLDLQTLIPGEATAAEAQRVTIRALSTQMQIDMDAATDVDGLRALVAAL
jgi:hypothetical protein